MAHPTASPPMNLPGLYESWMQDRDRILGFAEETAALVNPTLSPKGIVSSDRPDTSAGIQAHRTLRSSLVKTILPPGFKSFEIGFKPKVAALVEPAIQGGKAAIRAKFMEREREVYDALESKMVRPRVGGCIGRLTVESTSVVINYFDRLKVIPMRSFVVDRVDGEVRCVIICEARIPDPLDPPAEADDLNARQPGDVDAPVNPAEQKNDEKLKVYTLVHFKKKQVWRQVGDDQPMRVDTLKPSDPEFLSHRMVIVAVGEVPDVDPYPIPYFYNFLRLIKHLNHVDGSLLDAMTASAMNLLRISKNSDLADNPDSVSKKKPGEPIVADENEVGWVKNDTKMRDWQFAASMRAQLMQELRNLTASSLGDSQFGKDTSATAVLEIINQLSDQVAELMSALEETLHRPLIESEYYLQELERPMFPELAVAASKENKSFDSLSIVKVDVKTGVAAIERQRSILKFITQGLGAIKNLDPQFMVDGVECADSLRESMLIGDRQLYRKANTLDMLAQNGGLEQIMAALGKGGGGGQPARSPRDETIMTRGGPQPPQPAQPNQR